MKLKQNNLFPASDWFDINFFGGFASSPIENKRAVECTEPQSR